MMDVMVVTRNCMRVIVEYVCVCERERTLNT